MRGKGLKPNTINDVMSGDRKGIPLSSIMGISGHSTEKNLRKYLKLQAEDRGLIAAEAFAGFIKK